MAENKKRGSYTKPGDGNKPKNDILPALRGYSAEWVRELRCIASWEGMTLADLVRSNLNNLRLSYPEHKRKEFNS